MREKSDGDGCHWESYLPAMDNILAPAQDIPPNSSLAFPYHGPPRGEDRDPPPVPFRRERFSSPQRLMSSKPTTAARGHDVRTDAAVQSIFPHRPPHQDGVIRAAVVGRNMPLWSRS